ncbi:2-oxoacid:ferredoxin oxidoreductase subunit beta [Sphingomonas cavernae]|uniref:2-oxoacid:ferredoxin oxidoreductase subunit beta n=1 Tax=Sphingomonas cavernae TaxID=2320861 RepID=A0A418WPC5_9SPHN|nr:2-oxoacid:ferredoxin oxidoreductase subunit beta [Sphingomonas cavernae]RJF93071.1 2-oxoacid:ferredoxin oxidoreductase subunit beta [Sphingomonas cavernae]
MNEMTKIGTAKDWESDQEVRWCPGCGDYAILKAVQRTMPELGVRPEDTVFISGIGCSSRFPYYMETYGFHTIHGRAPAIATGVKLANPDLDVWIITGDGDALSIGGNHTMHLLRRNLDCQILLFNNEIYGLTKGQYSPTSRIGTRSPSTPFGSVDRPASPCAFALGSGARFVARGIDVNKKLPEVLKAAHAHKGAAFIEIFQNCIVYNDDVFAPFTDKANAAEGQLWLEHGQPMLFAGGSKGLRLNLDHLHLEIVDVVDGDWQSVGVQIHDIANRSVAHMLVELPFGAFPMALGVLYEDPRPSFEQAVIAQNRQIAEGKIPDLQKLVAKGQTWQVEKQPRVE